VNDFIPVNEPLLDGMEEHYLVDCIRTGWISSEGPFVRQFEEAFASRVGRRHAVAVCNGTAALELAVACLDLQPGDEIIMPSFTIISCAAAVIRAGAVPVMVDSDPDTWNMNVNQIETKITGRTKAVMPVHIYGLPVDMQPLMAIAAKHGLKVIEDAAEAHGVDCSGRPCGSYGDLSTFSFYPNKLITTGEGGMIVTDDPLLAERCRSLRNLCFQEGRRFVHEELGYNYRMTNLQAAVGLAQMERLDEFACKKRMIGSWYTALLAGHPLLQLPRCSTDYADNIYWVYGVVLSDKVSVDAAKVCRLLQENGIGTRPFFWPMHEQPVFLKRGMFRDESYPVAERLARRGFYLPSGLALTEDQAIRVSEELRLQLEVL
jgi:perosamine synthetase